MGCSKHFVLHDSFCYRYFGPDVRKPYHSAQKQCWRYQSSLVSLHSSREEGFVAALAMNQSGYWIGLNDEDGPGLEHREGHFKWSLGEELFNATDPLSYCRWKPGEPQNKRHLDCVKVEVEGWAMAPGGCAATRLPFICKRKGECILLSLCPWQLATQLNTATSNAIKYSSPLLGYSCTVSSICISSIGMATPHEYGTVEFCNSQTTPYKQK